jgi:hypothetical protein
MLGPYVILASPWIAFALHQAKKVTVDDNACISALGFFKVIEQQIPLAFRVVPMQVRDQQKLLPAVAGNFVNVFGVSDKI